MSTSSNNITIISDLEKKIEIQDKNLIIVEDNEDTKQSTVGELKKCFSGDYKEPSDMNFYSSKKIEDMMDGVKVELSTFASAAKVKSIEKRIADIVTTNGTTTTDAEIIYARDGESSLNDRLERDLNYIDDKYMKKSHKVVEGTQVSTGQEGYIDIHVKDISGPSTNVTLESKNKLMVNSAFAANNQIQFSEYGFVFTELNENDLSITIPVVSLLPKGKYFFFANIHHSVLFKDKGIIKLAVINTRDESAYKEFEYNQSSKFEFETPKAFDRIKIIFNKDKFVSSSVVTFNNVMLTKTDEINSFIPFEETISLEITSDSPNAYGIYNKNYDIICKDVIRVDYYDNNTSINDIQDDMDEVKSILIDHKDKCGLIENYGEYLFFDNVIREIPASCRISYDNDKFMRNGVPSLKMIFEEDIDINPVLDLPMKEYIENIDSVSLVFYMDKTDSYYFTTQEPITISLCSDRYDEPEMVNYMSVKINKSELVQGWNIIKKDLSEFARYGKVDEHRIQYVRIEVAKNSGLDNRVMYFNSVIFNQKMKPTVLLAFDGIYEEGVNYTYPYLTTREIPATILANNRTTYGNSMLNYISNLKVKHGWDIGQYGCNPNKELLTYDNNPRQQFLALKEAQKWLKDNLIDEPISYSAPYGNLRPITVPLLKDFGYKIAKTNSTGYCNFFDPKYDFAIPMTLMSNETTAEEIIEKIQYAIDNHCTICLYTNNVTDYGSELDAKKTLLESVIKFILENKDKIEIMTFSEFYKICSLSTNAYHVVYNENKFNGDEVVDIKARNDIDILKDNVKQIRNDSPYEIWLKEGNAGTEVEFLESLKGKDGKSAYQCACDAGYSGSEQEFTRLMVDVGSFDKETVEETIQNLEYRVDNIFDENEMLGIKRKILGITSTIYENRRDINRLHNCRVYEVGDTYIDFYANKSPLQRKIRLYTKEDSQYTYEISRLSGYGFTRGSVYSATSGMTKRTLVEVNIDGVRYSDFEILKTDDFEFRYLAYTYTVSTSDDKYACTVTIILTPDSLSICESKDKNQNSDLTLKTDLIDGSYTTKIVQHGDSILVFAVNESGYYYTEKVERIDDNCVLKTFNFTGRI